MIGRLKLVSKDRLALALLLAFPLLYFPDLPITTKVYRYLLIIAVLLYCLAVPSIQRQMNIQSRLFSNAVLGGGVLFFISILLSSLAGNQSLGTILFGESPFYLGSGTWAMFIVLGVVFVKIFNAQIVSKLTLYIWSLGLLLSAITYRYYIVQGLRIGGIMHQATSLSLFAALVAVICLYQLAIATDTKQKYFIIALLALSVSIVLLSQSRIGIIATAVVLVTYALQYVHRNHTLSMVALIFLISLVVVPAIMPTRFSRYHSESIGRGTSYRYGLYITSLKDLISQRPLIGFGPNTFPSAINQSSEVPEDIARSLRVGVVFNSSHNLFFDMAYQYGIIAALTLIGFTAVALRNYFKLWKSKPTVGLAPLLIFVCLLLNSLFNVPSLELTMLFVLSLIASLALTGTRISDPKRS